jgi:hypothetical protein
MPELNMLPRDPNSDLAGFEYLGVRPGPFQLWIGEAPIITDSAKSAVASAKKYELVALLPDGTVTTFIPGTHTAAQAVILAQAVYAIGQDAPHWNAGKFNHEAVQWPAGVALDTYAERKAFLNGTMLHVGHLI